MPIGSEKENCSCSCRILTVADSQWREGGWDEGGPGLPNPLKIK